MGKRTRSGAFASALCRKEEPVEKPGRAVAPRPLRTARGAVPTVCTAGFATDPETSDVIFFIPILLSETDHEADRLQSNLAVRIEKAAILKQSYGFENIRVMTYARIRNMVSLVLASAYFATAWIGRSIRREVLAEHLAHLGKRLGEVPEFAAYAIADGIKRAFTRFGKWVRTAADTIAKAHDVPAIQLLPGFAELFDIDDG